MALDLDKLRARADEAALCFDFDGTPSPPSSTTPRQPPRCPGRRSCWPGSWSATRPSR